MLKLYNSLSRKIEIFKPIDKEVKIYTCGPTVYDHVHIGNLSSFIYADLLARILEIDGYKIKQVMNITDIDDKMILRSKEEYPEESPENALANLAKLYETTFKQDISSVGIRLNKLDFIKATDSILQMQSLITKLVKNGFAYIADDGIYFSIEAYQKDKKKYGQLLELDIQNTSKARINNDEYDKHTAHDFALWKFMKPNEPAWSFEIDGKDYIGRPGWHIECSAMSNEKLGIPFDIHTGGIDLIFPHHENEIAQSTAGNSSPLYAKYFIHNEHLLIDKRKMSKSLGNVYNLTDLEEKKLDPLAFRLLILQSHYRNQANFSWELLKAASNRLKDLKNFAVLYYQTKPTAGSEINFTKITDEIKEASFDDLNIAKVLAILSNFQNLIQDELVNDNQKEEFKIFLNMLDNLLGLTLGKTTDINSEQYKIILDRDIARKSNDWKRSDELRDELLKSNIGIRDTTQGQIWFLV